MKILVIRLSAMGDILRTFPAVHSIRAHFPDARITWLSQKIADDLLEDQPEINEWIYFPRKDWFNVAKTAEFFKKLREREYDLLIDFHGNLKSAVLTALARGERKIGFGGYPSREGARWFYNEKVFCPREIQNRVEQSFLLLKHIGIEPKLDWNIKIKESALQFADKFLNPQKRAVFIFPGASARKYGKSKQWAPDGFKILGKTLLREEKNIEIIVGYGPGEEALARSVVEGIGEGARLTPKTTLSELSALISKSALYIGGDTGPTHLAWLLRTPTVALFLATQPERSSAPPGFPYRAVSLKPVASPRGEKDAPLEQMAEEIKETATGFLKTY